MELRGKKAECRNRRAVIPVEDVVVLEDLEEGWIKKEMNREREREK